MKKALVIDGEDKSRRMMVNVLSKLGFDVSTTQDVEEARLLIQEKQDIDLIMLDFNLPNDNGYDFLVKLRLEAEYVENPKVIMVTEEHAMGKMLSALAAGADEYIMKPFDQDIVVSKLNVIGIEHLPIEYGEHTCH